MSPRYRPYPPKQRIGRHPYAVQEGNKRSWFARKYALSHRHFSILAVICLFLGLALAACSSGSAVQEPTTAPKPTEEPTPEPTEEPQPTEEPMEEETAAADSSTALPRTIVDVNGEEVVIEDDSVVITLDGPVTEIAFALGAADRIVATDVSSTYPEEATQLPQVGYVRQLSAEPVLAMAPTLILTTDSAGPPEAVEQLEESGVAIAMFKSPQTVEESYQLVRDVAAALGLEEEGEALVGQIEADLAEAEALLAEVESEPRVMFIYARGVDTVMAAGTGTSLDVMLQLAGAVNAIDEWEDYQPLTPESAVSIAPDALLLFTSGLESVGGVEGLLAIPGLAETPAGQNGNVFHMDGLKLSGLGPRLGQAVLELIYMLHPELSE